MITAESWLKDLKIEEPLIKLNGQNITPFKIVGDLLFINGTAPTDENGNFAYCGRIGAEYSHHDGYDAARLTGLNVLRIIKDALGDLDRVDYVIKSMVLVNAVSGYADIYSIANGFSDVLTEVLGERGLHARNAVGASGLNGNSPVICDAIVKIRV